MAAEVGEEVVETLSWKILKWLGEKIAGQVVDFVVEKALSWIDQSIFGKPKTSEDVLRTMKLYQEELISEMKALFAEIEWESTLVDEFGSEEIIRNLWSFLMVIPQIQSEQERKQHITSLFAAVLDINQGVIHSLHALHDSLVGISFADPTKKGLLRIFATTLFLKMQKGPQDMSPATYVQHLESYLSSAFILQFMGLNLFCLAEQSEDVKRIQMTELEMRMKEQMKIIDEMRSAVLTVNSDDNHMYSIQICNKSEVLYGDPPSGRVWFRKRSQYNEDEEWVFRRSSTFATDGGMMIRKCGGFINIAGNEHLLSSDGRSETDYGGKFWIIPSIACDTLRDDKKMLAIIWSLGEQKYLGYDGKGNIALSDAPYRFEIVDSLHPDYIYTKEGMQKRF
ncbi:hypothetical protein DPMN_097883 [Dreissena polymorpha]|uniref:Uncharacterized protein n=1 Tax=Dreissena polymorpha TaxID=45954 RepID=A0A9D4R647_DREPO|nr:hypothetical protein DPMN_097883 [Dreissena polymorpha]